MSMVSERELASRVCVAAVPGAAVVPAGSRIADVPNGPVGIPMVGPPGSAAAWSPSMLGLTITGIGEGS